MTQSTVTHGMNDADDIDGQGWNDRVEIVEWNRPTGTVNTVVWRNAVSRRLA